MSVRKLDFRHMSHLTFPSVSALATRGWSSSSIPSVDVPSLVLMENMERTGAEVVFAAFRTLADAFNGDGSSKEDVVDSKVAFLSMRSEHAPLLPEPVKITFEHGEATR